MHTSIIRLQLTQLPQARSNSRQSSGPSNLIHSRPARVPPVCEAASSSGRPLQDFATSTKDNIASFLQRNRVQERAHQAGKAAGRRLKDTYEVVDTNLRRTATQVNEKFDVTGKAQQAATQVSEQAKVVDSRVGIKRRLRNLADDVQRKWPIWRKRYGEFSRTLLGQAVFLGFIFYLFYTGLAFRILNFLFILWWLAPFILVPFSRYFTRKVHAEAARRAEAQRKARAQQNPFFSSFFNAGRRPPPAGGQTPRKYNDPAGGPVIDVEYTSLDE